MTKGVLVVLAAACLAATTCKLGLDDSLGRSPLDPFPEIPRVTSFNGDYSIIVSWSEDEATDEYYLYRAADDLTPQYQLVYSGRRTEYCDQFAPHQEEGLYLYRLGKRRGKKLFIDLDTRGKAALGVVSISKRDLYEPNDERNKATALDKIVLYTNSWFYMSNSMDSVTAHDSDWYRITIPAHWVASVLLQDLDPPPVGNHFKIEVYNRGSVEIISNVKNDIHNPANTDEYFYFCIYPNFEIFQQNYSHLVNDIGSYGAFIQYTIRILELRPDQS